VDDVRRLLALEADVAVAQRPQTGADGLVGIDLELLQGGHELHAAAVHVADRLVVVQSDVQAVLVLLGEAAQKQHVLAARDDEDHVLLLGALGVRDAVRLGDPRHLAGVVDRPDERAAQRIGLGAVHLVGAQAGAVDDRRGVELLAQLSFLVGEEAVDAPLRDRHAGDLDLGAQPRHVLIGVDHRRDEAVRVDDPGFGLTPLASARPASRTKPCTLGASSFILCSSRAVWGLVK